MGIGIDTMVISAGRDLGNNKNTDVPRGYKQSGVGLIPQEWDYTSIGAMIRDGTIEKPLDGNHGNIHPTSGDFVDWGIPFVMASNVQGGRVDLVNCAFIRKEQADSLQKGFSTTGDVLLTHKATIGNTAIVGKTPFPYIMLTPQVTYYRVKDQTRLSNLYLRYFFDSAGFQRVLKALAGGGTRAYIGISAQHQLPIVLPPTLREQRAIAEVLSDMDRLLGGLKALIAKKRAIKQATMQQLLSGKTRLAGFTAKWEKKTLGDLASFLKGSGLSKVQVIPDGKQRCIHYGELFTTYCERIVAVVNGTDVDGEFLRSLGNDVLMPTSDVTPNGLATASCILEPGVILGGDILVIRAPSNVLNGEFLAYAIALDRNQVMQLVSGSTVFHLYGRDMAGFRFPVPCVEEQTTIVRVLSDMEVEISALEARLDKTRSIRQGMMQQLLTGRIRLVEPQPAEAET